MIPEPDSLSAPGGGTIAELLSWRPEHGVVSLHIRVDPADRSTSWRTEVRNGLSDLLKHMGDTGDQEGRQALVATTERLERDLMDEPPPGEPRGLIGLRRSDTEGRRRSAGIAAQIPPRTGPRSSMARSPRFIRCSSCSMTAPPWASPLSPPSESAARLAPGASRSSFTTGSSSTSAMTGASAKHRCPAIPLGEMRFRRPAATSTTSGWKRTASASPSRPASSRVRESRKRGWRQTLVFGDERYTRQFATWLRQWLRRYGISSRPI